MPKQSNRRLANRRLECAIVLLGALAASSPVRAQLVLPGALPPSAVPSVAPPAGGPAKPRAPGAGGPEAKAGPALKAPSEESVAGRQFQRNGATGVMAIEKSAAGLEIGRVAFVGYQISKPTDVCRVEIGGGKISLSSAPRYQGLLSYQASLEACPFSLDVLEGAVRVRGKTCDFVAADCRVDPSGVWGPSGAGIGPEESKTIESMRAKAESEARAEFRALLAATHGDKAKTKDIAREQAGFSSVREEICRDYAREDKHGFCASRITMAHAVALSAQLHGTPALENGAAPPPRKKRPPKPKPVAAAPLAPFAPPPQQ